MRIRPTCPEFWASDDLKQFDLSWVHDGPLPSKPAEWDALHPTGLGAAFVYLLSSGSDLLYVGKSWNVYRRIEKHRRKPWWGEVTDVGIVAVYGDIKYRDYRYDRSDAEQDAFRLEALAIHHLDPRCNISRPRVVAA